MGRTKTAMQVARGVAVGVTTALVLWACNQDEPAGSADVSAEHDALAESDSDGDQDTAQVDDVDAPEDALLSELPNESDTDASSVTTDASDVRVDPFDAGPGGDGDGVDDCLLHPFGERCCGDAAASEPHANNFMGCYCDVAAWDRLPSTPRKVCCVWDSELSCGRWPGDPQGVGRWVVLSVHDGTCSESVTPQCTVELMRQYTLDARDVEADGGDE